MYTWGHGITPTFMFHGSVCVYIEALYNPQHRTKRYVHISYNRITTPQSYPPSSKPCFSSSNTSLNLAKPLNFKNQARMATKMSRNTLGIEPFPVTGDGVLVVAATSTVW